MHILKCQLNRVQADALNAKSGRIYSQTLAWHYRVYRRTLKLGTLAIGDVRDIAKKEDACQEPAEDQHVAAWPDEMVHNLQGGGGWDRNP